jgi:hypothetical protein
MLILALDPASRLGYCIGESGQTPRSGTIRLKKPDDPIEVAMVNMAAWLRDSFVLELPDIVCIEHFLNPTYASSSQSAILAIGIYSVVAALCGLYNVRMIPSTPGQVRNFCCGRASALPSRRRGSAPRSPKEIAIARAATKKMVIDRAKLLQLVPPDTLDDNRCDAALVFYFASCKYGRAIPKELYLFGEPA